MTPCLDEDEIGVLTYLIFTLLQYQVNFLCCRIHVSARQTPFKVQSSLILISLTLSVSNQDN
jgi:hypothetical protein